MAELPYAEALTKKHHALELQLLEAYTHHFPDSQILELKKRKLALKDAISRLEHLRRHLRNRAA